MNNWVILCVFLTCIFAAPPRPQISEVFEGIGELALQVDNKTYKGEILIAMDQPAGRGLEEWRLFGNHQFDRKLLQRYDMNKTYSEEGALKMRCISTKVNGAMPAYWDWVKEATYVGRLNIMGKDADLWQLSKGHATVRVAVLANDTSIPVYVGRRSNERDVGIYFREFHAVSPNSDLFNVPRECVRFNALSKRQCVDRGTMISNAQVWVDNQVPYNQGATYQGYREDCSGYVSMAWEGPQPGWTTSTLPGVANPIDQGDMQPGDVLLNVGEHVVLFGGWASSDMSQYYAYEETRPGEGTVYRTTPFPYWYDTASFVPYSYTGAC